MLYFAKMEMERKPLVVRTWDRSQRIAKSEIGKPSHTEELTRTGVKESESGKPSPYQRTN
jgi:hypothetical protein